VNPAVRVRYIQAAGLSLPPVEAGRRCPQKPGVGIIVARDYDGQFAVVQCDFEAAGARD
jgi:hypothetical protein